MIYFIAIILGCKLGLLRTPKYPDYRPRRLYPGNNYQRGNRYKNNWHFKNRRHWKKNEKNKLKSPISLLSAFTSVLNVDERCLSRDTLHYETYSSTMVCDNSANVHICNRRKMFVGEIRKVSNKQVATIGVKWHQPSGIGIVKWIWRDDPGKSHEYLVEDVLLFPQSPINILSVTCFARQFNDMTGTDINTNKLQPRFYWDSNKFLLTIQHPPSNIPEISINEGFALLTIFVRSYWELLMFQIIQYMAVVLPIWMLMMKMKIIVLTNM